MSSVGAQFPIEQARVRQLLTEYVKLGPPGTFAAAMIEADLKAADAAWASGDLVEILSAYQRLIESQ